MMPHDRHGTGRESLSALFDGELGGDAARFTLKRLVQDPQWRDACSNWQLAGDALRGRSTAAAPADFASRVQVALAEKAETAGVGLPATQRHVPRHWVGGAALAASMAAIALFMARPDPYAVPDPAAPASRVATTETATAPTATANATATGQPPARDIGAPRIAGAATTLSDTSTPRQQSARAGRALGQPGAAVPAAAVGMGDVAVIDASLRPFQQAADRIAVRPWPRAVLPGPAAAGGLTAGFDPRFLDDRGDSPTFYPFDPRFPGSVAGASDGAGPQP